MKVPYTQNVQYISHTQHNCTITTLPPCIQPIYRATETKNSNLMDSHTAIFTHKQNINTPNHIMCTNILIQFRSWKTEFQTTLSQHPSIGPSQRLGTTSVCGCRTPPVSQSVSQLAAYHKIFSFFFLVLLKKSCSCVHSITQHSPCFHP